MTGGFFLTLEGIDGAGKSSHLDAIEQALAAAGRTVRRTREPGGTPLAETLRELVLTQPMDALCEALLVFAARRDHVVQVIRPALARGEVVLCDRFTDATFAYQGAGRGFDLDRLRVLERWVQGGEGDAASEPAPAGQAADSGGDAAGRPLPGAGPLLRPDLTLWFELPPAQAAARLADARAPDRFEAETAAFFGRVAAGYADRAAREPARFARIDADRPREAVWQQVLAALQARGLLDGGGPPA